jgi:hypothetical protein
MVMMAVAVLIVVGAAMLLEGTAIPVPTIDSSYVAAVRCHTITGPIR